MTKHAHHFKPNMHTTLAHSFIFHYFSMLFVVVLLLFAKIFFYNRKETHNILQMTYNYPYSPALDLNYFRKQSKDLNFQPQSWATIHRAL